MNHRQHSGLSTPLEQKGEFAPKGLFYDSCKHSQKHLVTENSGYYCLNKNHESGCCTQVFIQKTVCYKDRTALYVFCIFLFFWCSGCNQIFFSYSSSQLVNDKLYLNKCFSYTTMGKIIKRLKYLIAITCLQRICSGFTLVKISENDFYIFLVSTSYSMHFQGNVMSNSMEDLPDGRTAHAQQEKDKRDDPVVTFTGKQCPLTKVNLTQPFKGQHSQLGSHDELCTSGKLTYTEYFFICKQHWGIVQRPTHHQTPIYGMLGDLHLFTCSTLVANGH